MDIVNDGEKYINYALDGAVIIILLLYVLFSFIIVRQVQLMSKVLVTGVNKYVYLLAVSHLAFAIVLSLIIALTII